MNGQEEGFVPDTTGVITPTVYFAHAIATSQKKTQKTGENCSEITVERNIFLCDRV